MNKLNDESWQVLMGSVLGDGSLIKNGLNCYFEETHSIKQEEYLRWKQKFFPDSTLSYRDYYSSQTGKQYKQARLRVPNSPVFTGLRKIFYPEGKKKLSKKV